MTDPRTNSDLAARLARVAGKHHTTLTHIGRKSGKSYRVTIWFTVDGDHINVQTMNMGRQWIANVLANPKVSLKIGDEVFEGTAAQVTTEDDMRRVVSLMKKKYPISIPYLWIKKQPDGAFRVTFA